MKFHVDGEHCSNPTKSKHSYTITLATTQCYAAQITISAQMNTSVHDK